MWLAPQRTSAAQADIWLGCSAFPVAYRQFLPTQGLPARPQPARPKLAQPTAAPPSAALFAAADERKSETRPITKPLVAETAKPEAAAKQTGAAVREEGPFYDTFPIALKAGQKPADDQCTVTFTNLSDRRIKVMLGNQERNLGTGESASLPVKRQFVWHMEGREAQNEQVGTGDFALQIVIRR
jgi:hypothetical protein